MNKRVITFYVMVFLICICFTGIIYSITNPAHETSEILLTINGYEMTLNESLYYGILQINSSSYPSISSSTMLMYYLQDKFSSEDELIELRTPYHKAEEIFINLAGTQMNLQEAISNKVNLCGGGLVTMSSVFGHSGEVIFVNGSSIQAKINNCTNLCQSHSTKKCYNSDIYWYDSCGNIEDRAQDCSHDCLISGVTPTCVRYFYDWGTSTTCTNKCNSQGLTAFAIGRKYASASGSTPPAYPSCSDTFMNYQDIEVSSNAQQKECATWNTYDSFLDKSWSFRTTLCMCKE